MKANVAKISKSSQTKSSRAFQLTLNEVENFDEIRNYLMSLKSLNYFLAGKEKAPSTGHLHIHIYVQFNTAVRLSLTKLKGAHVEKCFGSPQQNIAYIRKEDTEIIYEKGNVKNKGGNTIAEVKQMKKEERDNLPLQYAKIVQQINNEEAKKIKVSEYYKEREVYWLYGASGLGKTKRAVEIMKKKEIEEFNEVKFDGNFWHGASEECSACLYDDWRDTQMKPTELINFIDYNTHIMNVKGGSVRNKYKLIIITSIQNPEKIYMNTPEEYKKQWLRRIKEIQEFQEV